MIPDDPARRTPLDPPRNPPKARKPLRYRSAHQEDPEEIRRRSEVREIVFTRDGHRCQFPHGARWPLTGAAPPACYGRLTPHHLEKAWKGAPYEPENLLSLASACNDWVEDHPALALELGLVVARGVDHQEAQRRRASWGSTW